MKNSYHFLRRRVSTQGQLGLTTLAITLLLMDFHHALARNAIQVGARVKTEVVR